MDKKITDSDLYKKIYHSQPIQILISVDYQITKNLIADDIITRPGSNGIWCCTLLPTVLVVYTIMYEVSELYTFLAYISVGLLCYCLLFIVFLSLSNLVLKEHIYGGCETSGLVATLFIYASLGYGLTFSLVYPMIALYSFSMLLKEVLKKCPQTFTLGEAMLVVQSIILFSIMAVCKILYNNMSEVEDDETEMINAVIFTVLSSVGIIVTALCFLDERLKTPGTLGYIASIAGVYALVILHYKLGMDCIIQVASYFLLDNQKWKLTWLWFCLVVLAVVVVLARTQLKTKANTVTRKTFHVLASIVFLSGILMDINLMKLAAGVGFGLMVLVEALRKSGIEKISPALQAAFEVYSDEKDAGSFAMTPIYLFVGLACPLLLVPEHPGYELELLSGVLSIGVGDTAASWFGSKYGFNKWADGQKSVEGTIFNVLSQVGLMYALQFLNLTKINYAMLRVAVTATISGLVEAKTDQVDNLVLPLVSLLAFQLTTVFSY